MVRSVRGDEVFMREALRLAKKGQRRTYPNPVVGTVIVKEGRIIARGFHRAFGMPHAEVEALSVVGKRARGATLYTTLEPCSHFGKTPPCADAIVRAGVTRVVSATRDPNGIARGGVEKLRKAGIKVSLGTCEKEARALNNAFFTFHEKGRPFVALKFAASLDGKLATRTGDSKWITNETARRFARALRGEYQAVLVGIETILADNSRLTSRTRGMREPIRIILDSHLRMPRNARVLADMNVIIATTRSASKQKRREFERRGIRVLVYGGGRVPIKRLLASLGKFNIASVLVEGGGSVLGSFLDAGLVDKVYAFYTPILIGGEKAVSIGGLGARVVAGAFQFRNISIERFGDNILIIASR
ncbi:bifunctional diaminohydroxyphosphoribosylaminopyrimidine deaminase/5-amino-6-(5-phosphoribosylamino)uracil reductase RibD [Candidatus Kaiserbacteria bacterium]|nr:bifunctional diaminohydroxyphosphoribosylaminopyrimidine deaminase/5-amino-6-(5-phosphoribosylamino)uracil reductase RibD [Candidatus Kaiserbacteria bacterium]